MAEKEVISQEEIDALLEKVDEVADEEGDEALDTEQLGSASDEQDVREFKPTELPEDNGIKTIDFKSQERIVKGKLPVLDKIYDRAVRLFMTDLYQLTTKDFEIKQDPLSFVVYSDFMNTLTNPCLINVYNFKPLRGKGFIIFDNVFVYDLVDHYYGGNSRFLAQQDREDFTATELRVMELVAAKLAIDLTIGWETIFHIELSKCPNDETNPQLVHVAEPDEMLLVSRFHLNFGKETGSFYIVLPYMMVETIKQQLELGASRADDEIDPNWIKSLKVELMEVELTVSAIMAETRSSLGNILSWQAGDFIPLSMNETIHLDIENHPSFVATLGSSSEKRALKIIKKIGG